MDESRRQQLIGKIRELGFPRHSHPRPVVTLEEFFIGNDDLGSIGCNLPEHPGIETFFKVLQDIRSREGVQDVVVEISDVEEIDTSSWPFSDRIYILSRIAPEQIEDWLAVLLPDEVSQGYVYGVPLMAPALQSGMSIYSAWWD